MGDYEYYEDRHAAEDDSLVYGYTAEMINAVPNLSIPRGGIQFPTTQELAKDLDEKFNEMFSQVKEMGQKMKSSQELISEAENLRQQAERLEQIAEQRAKYGEDPFKNGTVFKVDMKYRDSNRSYAYAVIKVGGKFYLSGRMSGPSTIGGGTANGYTWENFVAWLAQGDATVWRARQLEQVL
jgi:hypothetical protein